MVLQWSGFTLSVTDWEYWNIRTGVLKIEIQSFPLTKHAVPLIPPASCQPLYLHINISNCPLISDHTLDLYCLEFSNPSLIPESTWSHLALSTVCLANMWSGFTFCADKSETIVLILASRIQLVSTSCVAYLVRCFWNDASLSLNAWGDFQFVWSPKLQLDLRLWTLQPLRLRSATISITEGLHKNIANRVLAHQTKYTSNSLVLKFSIILWAE